MVGAHRVLLEEATMNVVKKVFGRIGHALRSIWSFATGDDLQEAQRNRGDYHEYKSGTGGPAV